MFAGGSVHAAVESPVATTVSAPVAASDELPAKGAATAAVTYDALDGVLDDALKDVPEEAPADVLEDASVPPVSSGAFVLLCCRTLSSATSATGVTSNFQCVANAHHQPDLMHPELC